MQVYLIKAAEAALKNGASFSRIEKISRLLSILDENLNTKVLFKKVNSNLYIYQGFNGGSDGV
jgi:hypothetical protein